MKERSVAGTLAKLALSSVLQEIFGGERPTNRKAPSRTAEARQAVLSILRMTPDQWLRAGRSLLRHGAPRSQAWPHVLYHYISRCQAPFSSRNKEPPRRGRRAGQGGAMSTSTPGTQGRLGAVQTARVDVVSDVLHALESQLRERVIEEVCLYQTKHEAGIVDQYIKSRPCKGPP